MFNKSSDAHKLFTKHNAGVPGIFSKVSHAHAMIANRGFENPRSTPTNGLEIRRKI